MKIFISYRTINVNHVRAIIDVLKGLNIDVWFAEYEVLTGNYDSFVEEIDDELATALKECTHGVIFTNKEWYESRYCRREGKFLLESLEKEKLLQICCPLENSPFLEIQSNPNLTTSIIDLENTMECVEFILSSFEIDRSLPDYKLYLNNLAPQSFNYGSISILPPPYFKKLPSDAKLGWVGRMHEFVYGGKVFDSWVRLEINIDPFNSPVDALTFSEFWEELKADDRVVYSRLRDRAHDYLKNNKSREYGLHLYIYEDMGHVGLTYYSFAGGNPRDVNWYRFYSFTINDETYRRPVTITLEFTVFSRNLSLEKSRREFFKLLPIFNEMTASFVYEGHSSLQEIPSKEAVDKMKKAGNIIGVALGVLTASVLFFIAFADFFRRLEELGILFGIFILIVSVMLWRFLVGQAFEYKMLKKYFNVLLKNE